MISITAPTIRECGTMIRTERLKQLFEELMLLNAELTAVTTQIYYELGLKCEHKHVDPQVIMQCSKCKQEVKHDELL